jgi:L-threonylcarbamoyladenylate synthase
MDPGFRQDDTLRAGSAMRGVSAASDRPLTGAADTVRAAPPVLPPTTENLEAAATALAAGRLVAFPTETVYGLGASALDERAVARLYAAKRRPRFNPLIVHVADAAAAAALVAFDARAARLAAAFWPGPLTLVLPRRRDCPVSLLAGAGLDSLAVRVPAHPVALALLGAFGGPLVAPSANRSGRVSPTAAAHVAEDFADAEGVAAVAMILDGGPCRVGVESTVLDLTGAAPRLLRPGGLAAERLEAVIGRLAAAEPGAAPRAPGQLASHYAPRLPVRLEAAAAAPGEALLGFGPAAPPGVANLSPAGDLAEAAANLFAMLRRLDRPGFTGIAVMPVPETGLGIAINDRLRRAAAPRG